MTMSFFLVFFALAFGYCNPALAYDFEVDGIYYNILSQTDQTVEVTYRKYYSNYVNDCYYDIIAGTNYNITGYVCEYTGDIVIPNQVTYGGYTYSVTQIGSWAFGTDAKKYDITSWTHYQGEYNSSFKRLKSISLPSTIRFINEYAFKNCTGLSSIEIPYSLSSISLNTFYGCSGITTIEIPQNIDSIYSGAFYGCSFVSVIIPSSVSYIGVGAFSSELKNAIMLSPSPPAWDGGYPFDKATELIVPSKKMYEKEEKWQAYTLIEMLSPSQEEFTYIGKAPSVSWTNNLKAYTMTVSESALHKDAGTYADNVKADFYKNGKLAFSVEFPYEYTINKAPLDIVVNDATRKYGEENPTFTYTYSGFVDGEDASVLDKEPTPSTIATKTSDVGTYSITATLTDKNYEANIADGTLTITKAPLNVVVNDATRKYGEDNPSFSCSYTGFVNSDNESSIEEKPSFTTTATKGSDVGSYPIIATLTTKNYETSITNGTLTIMKAPLKVNVNDATRKYGEANPDFTCTYSGFVNGDNVSVLGETPEFSTTATASSDVGTYAISASLIAKNYDAQVNEGTLTITKAPLNVIINDASREYGEDNPSFSCSYLGFVNGDNQTSIDESPEYKTTATRSSNVGQYNITASVSAKNYEANVTAGTLTITKAPLAVTAEDAMREYGVDNPVFNLTYDGLKLGEQLPVMESQIIVSTTARKDSPVGKYSIIPSGGVAKNYSMSYFNGTLTVSPAIITVKANPASKKYGEENPSFSYSLIGKKVSTDQLTTEPQFECNATKGSAVGEYAIKPYGAVMPNYDIFYENGMLSVEKRLLSVSTQNHSRKYGDNNPVFTLSYDGFVNDENEENLLIKPTATCVASKTSDVGNYPIVVSGGESDNYSFAYNNGMLSITQAEQEIIWEQEFENVQVGDQIELTATATSMLPIEYTISDESIASLYTAGVATYLDCIKEGTVVIRAIQEGNNNYYSAVRKSKTISVFNTSGIDNINDKERKQMSPVYDLMGRRVTNTISGQLYIRHGKKFKAK